MLESSGSTVRLEAGASLGTDSEATAALLAGFEAEGVVVRARAEVGCVLLTAAVDSAQVSSAASAAVGLELPSAPGRICHGGGRRALWLSPRSWLVHCAVAEEVELVRSVNGCFVDKSLHAVRFTDALCWLEVSGSGAVELLSEGGFLSLEPAGLAIGYAKRTMLAQMAVILMRESESVWLVAIERSRAPGFMDWLRACRAGSGPLKEIEGGPQTD